MFIMHCWQIPWIGHHLFASRKTKAITTLEVTDMSHLHKDSSHSLNDCMSFRQKPIGDRKKMILTNGICFKCCSGKKHRAKNCKADVKCSVSNIITSDGSS